MAEVHENFELVSAAFLGAIYEMGRRAKHGDASRSYVSRDVNSDYKLNEETLENMRQHKAGVKHPVLFHHDPTRTDDDLDRIGEQAIARHPGAIVAREGLELVAGVAPVTAG